mmetsp:Transcript_8465/g.21859  ORF Transcript_8465/g.21859 Transcript_8465/m.21859 type:complete len:242 (-) Transcript_8465:117-842(-)
MMEEDRACPRGLDTRARLPRVWRVQGLEFLPIALRLPPLRLRVGHVLWEFVQSAVSRSLGLGRVPRLLDVHLRLGLLLLGWHLDGLVHLGSTDCLRLVEVLERVRHRLKGLRLPQRLGLHPSVHLELPRKVVRLRVVVELLAELMRHALGLRGAEEDTRCVEAALLRGHRHHLPRLVHHGVGRAIILAAIILACVSVLGTDRAVVVAEPRRLFVGRRVLKSIGREVLLLLSHSVLARTLKV